MSKKKGNKPSAKAARAAHRPKLFSTPGECIKCMKKSVYLIARGRNIDEDNPDRLNFVTIGSACVVAPNKMITAAHVINNPNAPSPLATHADSDSYYLIRHDDENNWHAAIVQLTLDTNLFIYPDLDLAIIYLPDSFYEGNQQVFALKDDYIRIDPNFRTIGTDVAVLGYPLCVLNFEEEQLDKPMVGNILLRADAGIINCRFRTASEIAKYQFTMPFNPGNSGGPIFNWRNGQLLSIVQGYDAIAVNIKEQPLNAEQKQDLGIEDYTEDSFIDVIHAIYSNGFATHSFVNAFKEHNIL